MGYAIIYSSVDPIPSHVVGAVQLDVDRINKCHTWLSCEPLILSDEGTGRLCGTSKPTFEPDANDAASAALEGLPDGTVSDLLNALCELSRDHAIDWQVGDDYEVWGIICNGQPDREIVHRISTLGEFADAAAEMMNEIQSDRVPEAGPDSHADRERDDDFPPTIKLWTE